MFKGIKTLVAVLVLASSTLATFAGPTRGPLIQTARVPALQSHFYNESFVGGVPTAIAIHGDGDTDLDIFVYNSAGQVVARAIGLSDREVVTFTPPVTGSYRVEVRNLGIVWNQYSIAMR